jgi:transcription initiation factor IIE alpha subunit
MNSKTLAKIKAAIPFLVRFRQDVPVPLQILIAPYLDQPYQLTLKVMDCCTEEKLVSIDAIATKTGINPVSVRQVLNLLQNSGVALQSTRSKHWQRLAVPEQPHRETVPRSVELH